GLGEFAGHVLRLASGVAADRTRAYWPLTFLGYGLMLAVPALALVTSWPAAAACLVLERAGKALRSPARDAILAGAAREVGRGTGFGLHEALDQVGAVAGPLLLAGVFALGLGYRAGFAVLVVPVGLALLALWRARAAAPPEPPRAGAGRPGAAVPTRLGRRFRAYVLFTFFAVLGLANFPLVAYHLGVTGAVSRTTIPLLYALAMGVDALAALAAGRLYDRLGLAVIGGVPVLTAGATALAFAPGPGAAVTGVVLWGAVMGLHEAVMRAAVADLAPRWRRGTAYGIFHAVYGAAWLAGGWTMGALHDAAPGALAAFAAGAELLALAAFAAGLRPGQGDG
ncbi:MFS transporter, partial [Dissulfurirhabdus thermomarina]